MALKHKKTNTVPAWTQTELDAAIAAGRVPAGTTLSGFTLSTDWNEDHIVDSGGITFSDNTVQTTAYTGLTAIPAYSALVNNTNASAAPSGQQFLMLGAPGYTDTGILAQFTSQVAGYNQVIAQNTSNATNASSGYIVSNNLGTGSTYFGEFGINSSTFTGTGSFNLPNATYVSATSGELVLGTASANGVRFVINGATTDVLAINSSSQTVLTGQSSSLFSVGRQGQTAPAFLIDNSATNSATGVEITSNAAGSGVRLDAVSTGTNETLIIASKGSGNVSFPLAASGSVVVSGNSTTNFVVGRNGATNPAFTVDTSLSTGATGIQINPAASGSGVSITTTGGTNETLTINSKAGGNLILNSPSASTVLQAAASNKVSVSSTTNTYSNSFHTYTFSASGTPTARYLVTSIADTGLTASTESIHTHYNLAAGRQHAAGTIATQRDFRITGTVHSFVTASTITDCAAFSVDGPTSAGTSATLTSSHGIYVPTVALTGTVTNAYAATFTAPTGATNNYALYVAGAMRHTNRTITAARTLDSTDYQIFADTSGSSFTVTLPTAVGRSGLTYSIKKTSATNTLTVATTSSQTIDGATTYSATAVSNVRVMSDGANWWIV